MLMPLNLTFHKIKLKMCSVFLFYNSVDWIMFISKWSLNLKYFLLFSSLIESCKEPSSSSLYWYPLQRCPGCLIWTGKLRVGTWAHANICMIMLTTGWVKKRWSLAKTPLKFIRKEKDGVFRIIQLKCCRIGTKP